MVRGHKLSVIIGFCFPYIPGHKLHIQQLHQEMMSQLVPVQDDIRLEVSGKCSIEYWYSWTVRRFRYEVGHVVMNCINPQESLRALRALGACREQGEAGETSTCCCKYLSDFPNLHFTIVFWVQSSTGHFEHCLYSIKQVMSQMWCCHSSH